MDSRVSDVAEVVPALEQRRARWRRYRLQDTDRKRNADPHALRCAIDGYAFRYRTDGAGHEVRYCQACEWRRARLCQDCGRPVRGLSWRCDRHKKEAIDRQLAAHEDRNRDEINRRQSAARKRLRVEDPERYAHHLAVKKAWRQRNVVRIKLQKRKWRLNPNRPNGYSSREKYEAYHRRYRAKHAAHRRELAKRRYYELHPDRPHPTCAVLRRRSSLGRLRSTAQVAAGAPTLSPLSHCQGGFREGLIEGARGLLMLQRRDAGELLLDLLSRGFEGRRSTRRSMRWKAVRGGPG